jgi:hypothetical protein
VNTARAVLPQPPLSGGQAPPVLPRLADALTGGTFGIEQARTIVQTMNGLPAGVDPDTRDLVADLLVEHGQLTEPHPFAVSPGWSPSPATPTEPVKRSETSGRSTWGYLTSDSILDGV